VAQLSRGPHDSPAGPPGDALGLDDLATEAGSKPAADYDVLPTQELVELMRRSGEAVLPAVAGASEAIAAAIDALSDRLAQGGRLVYVGAGSSGRLGALDAAECESTFSTAPGQVVALVAGGMGSPSSVQERAEDDHAAGATDIRRLQIEAKDAVVGVSASGRTPYVVGALTEARSAGALTAAVVSVERSELTSIVDLEIAVVVGPEFLAGSTRLNAGTAQKLVLNMISTISMIRLGKTYGNLMVDVLATNEKLRARVRRMVIAATGAAPDQVDEALEASNGNAKVAIVSLLADVDADAARARLDKAGDNTRLALGS
jgi:N-acetylmuramic acid 6-phosphate etherase